MNRLLDDALALWAACPDTLPDFGPSFQPVEQSAAEAQLDRFLGCLQAELEALPRSAAARRASHTRISAAFDEFGRGALHLDEDQMQLLLSDGFAGIGARMARRAREFDAAVPLADVQQASRNAWTACGLQLLFGRKIALTPSIFAYSMLYPYTDNYLDDPAASPQDKLGFSHRFGSRLAGRPVPAANSREETIWRLAGLIEGEYARTTHPRIFESLLDIHAAQHDSLRLRRNSEASYDEVLGTSFHKGGASVLADAWLAASDLSPEQARFAFLWGVLLQLGDDLQDLTEDLDAGVLTLFTQAAARIPLDRLTCRTLHFAGAVMALMPQSPTPTSPALRGLIHKSSFSLIIRAAGAAGGRYSPAYLAGLERHSPFRFAALAGRKRSLGRRSARLSGLFEAFLEGSEDEPVFPWLPSSLMPR
ncbi:MAG: class 1 isoprenoid biosynthesis enzyme [Candidatus Solibacter usitatus]|nr:class 1 isoprenoid biosynthesis enzyme [Candidatus Solibacter usitatus]